MNNDILKYFYNKLITDKEVEYTKESNTYYLINSKLLNYLNLILYLNGYILYNNVNNDNIKLYIEEIKLPKREISSKLNLIERYLEKRKHQKEINYLVAYNLYHRIIKSTLEIITINKDMFIYNYINEEVLVYIETLCNNNDLILVDKKTKEGFVLNIHRNNKKLKKKK